MAVIMPVMEVYIQLSSQPKVSEVYVNISNLANTQLDLYVAIYLCTFMIKKLLNGIASYFTACASVNIICQLIIYCLNIYVVRDIANKNGTDAHQIKISGHEWCAIKDYFHRQSHEFIANTQV